MTSLADIETLQWIGNVDGCLRLIDQTLLPAEFREIECHAADAVWESIKTLRIRGAPAIGLAAAYGLVLGVRSFAQESKAKFFDQLREVAGYLASSRPTAINLFWALDRMQATAAQRQDAPPAEVVVRLLEEARKMHDEDRSMCRAIGRHGADLLHDGQGVLTHCNAGGLATSGFGTALAVLFTAHEQGKRLRVFADETRPLLQGSRLTAWELRQRGLNVTVLCDSMAGQVMKEGRIQAVIVGADRITANGDTANKIGTYGLAVLALAHNIPFYVAAPSNTFDLALATGDTIPIEQRAPREVSHGFNCLTVPEGVAVYNPAFDVTPARLIRAIVTECGVIEPVTTATIRAMLLPEISATDRE